uniref:Uncharacterized protein n=1 Tax=Euglena viridis TaxID=3040 RepID=M1EV93_EUGVI|nr:hypothetical protein I642_p065 [Euglena viridis]AEY70780.1 hypothetical protein [Euglena viridis]
MQIIKNINTNNPSRNWDFVIGHTEFTKENLFLTDCFKDKWSLLLRSFQHYGITFILFYFRSKVIDSKLTYFLHVYVEFDKTCRLSYIQNLFNYCDGALTIISQKKAIKGSRSNIRDFILFCGSFKKNIFWLGRPRREHNTDILAFGFIKELGLIERANYLKNIDIEFYFFTLLNMLHMVYLS